MKKLFVVFAHLLSAFATVLKPGGANGPVEENLLLRQQLLFLRRSRRQAPNLRNKDRLLGGFWSFVGGSAPPTSCKAKIFSRVSFGP
jgi:hypothetical protein